MRQLGKLGARGGARMDDANGGEIPAILTHDDKEVFRGTWNDCLAWLHRNQSSSWHHAFLFEGYELTTMTDQT